MTLALFQKCWLGGVAVFIGVILGDLLGLWELSVFGMMALAAPLLLTMGRMPSIQELEEARRNG